MEDVLQAAVLSRLTLKQQTVVAERPLAQGEPILALPLSTCWTASTARACTQLSGLDANAPDSTWLALHLLLVKQKRVAPELHKQLELLDDSGAGLLCWDDDELSLLKGSRWMHLAQQGREEMQAEFEELREVLGEAQLSDLGVTVTNYLWAQASLERCLLRFLNQDGNPVEVFMPTLTVLEADSQCCLPKTAADCARLEFLEGQEPALVFYAPMQISAGEKVPVCHAGIAGGSGRLLLQRGRLWLGNPWEHVEFVLTLPVPTEKLEETSHKVAALALPPPTAGQFLVPELLEGWEPAQLGQQLQLNIRVSAQQPLPRQQLELLEFVLDDGMRARQVLQHGLLSIQKGYAAPSDSSGYPSAIASPQRGRPERNAAARGLLEEEKRLVALSLASLGTEPEVSAEEADFYGTALIRLQGCTAALQILAASFTSFKPGQAEAKLKLAELQVLRASLAGLPEGNPESVHTVPLVQTNDPVLKAHGEATRAVLDARVAGCEWEIATLEAEGNQSALQAGVLGEAAALQVKMLKFPEAYEKLSRSLQLMPSDAARRLKLDCAVALACRRRLRLCDGISWSEVSNEGQLLKKRLQTLGYTASNLPQAAKVPSMLHLVSNRAAALEQNLQGCSSELKDLLRLLLLRQPLPLQRVLALLSHGVTTLLLRLQALFAVGMGHELMSPEEIMGCEGAEVQIFSAVAWWPVGDLLIATDYGDTQHAAGEFEPVMYLSLDSYALVDAAPRKSALSVLDICCGSGVQGLVALRHYAKEATFLDVNPRAISFSCFNAAVNGFHQQCSFVEGSILKDMCPELQGKTFDVILANPPFVPNPDGTASAAGPLYSGGGHDGEEVHKALVQKGLTLLAPGGRLCSVAEVPNPEAFPKRVQHWLEQTGCNTGCVKIFTGKTIAAEEYWKKATQDRSPLEWRRYLSGLQRLGVTSVAEALLLLTEDGSTNLNIDAVSRETLWHDVSYLRTQVAHCLD